VPVGYTDKLLYAAGGNPYGTSYNDPRGQPMPPEKLAAARYQGGRMAKFAALLAPGRA
jgi:NAD(P)H dehydrogenase (quinone)